MKQETICPILTKTDDGTHSTTHNEYGIFTVFCKHEQCAWWIEDKQKCAIAVMGGKR